MISAMRMAHGLRCCGVVDATGGASHGSEAGLPTWGNLGGESRVLRGMLEWLAGTWQSVGNVLGINRDISGKPTGMRTLGLVALGAAAISTGTLHYADLDQHPDALSRVLQGLIQGVLTGVGFIGAGVILRDNKALDVHGLTTAATVWVTAALGVACGVGAWATVLVGTAFALLLLAAMKPVERAFGMGDEHLPPGQRRSAKDD
jgi:putative Mg2+ transporter-C (MgtC) family protein